MTTKYKFANAHEWLKSYLHRQDSVNYLRTLAFTFAREMDSDAIQELFEKEMDADGYFDKEAD